MQSPTPWTENQFGSIYNKYFPILFRFALKHSKDATLSKDLAQECLIKLWQDNFMPNATQNHLEAFLFRVIRNSLIDHFRKEKIRNSYAESLEKKIPTTDGSPLFEVEERIEKVMSQLPELTQNIFSQSREKGQDYKTIAANTGKSIKTVEHHISKALKAFRKEFFRK